VGEVLTALTGRYPDLRKQIFTDEGKLRSFVNVYLNDEDIRYLEQGRHAGEGGDTLSLVPHRRRARVAAPPAQRRALSKTRSCATAAT
jgi:molybdopterin converting factor small subunit